MRTAHGKEPADLARSAATTVGLTPHSGQGLHWQLGKGRPDPTCLCCNQPSLAHEPTAPSDASNIEELEAENLVLAAAYLGSAKAEVANIKTSLQELA